MAGQRGVSSVPIPGNSPSSIRSSRVEDMINSLEDRRRPRYSTSSRTASASGHPRLSTSFNSNSSTPSSFQPRIIRAPDSHGTTNIYAPSISHSPTRIRSNTNTKPLFNIRPASTRIVNNQGTPSFEAPSYLSNAVLGSRMHGGPLPPQPVLPEPRIVPETRSGMSDSDDDPTLPENSPPRRHGSRQTSSTWPAAFSIPTQWNESDKSPYLIISPNGRDVTFNGQASAAEREAGAVRAECPIPAACGIYYYEVEVLDRGIKGQISVGFATKDLGLSRLPGWEVGSWGYHGDDGLSFAGQPRAGSEFGPRFSTGDVIGCGVNFLEHNAFYTKNGRFIGTVFNDLPDQDLYPAIGLRTSNERVRTNFGGIPFRFDIDSYVSDIKIKAWQAMQQNAVVHCRLSNDSRKYVFNLADSQPLYGAESQMLRAQQEQLGGPMADLALKYLMHHGYAKSARALSEQLQRAQGDILPPPVSESCPPNLGAADIDMDNEEEGSGIDFMFKDAEQRGRIIEAVIQGDIELALSLMGTLYPASLLHDGGFIHFRLRCRRFVELVVESAEALKRISTNAEKEKLDATGAGAVASESANAMDLDEEEQHYPLSPTPASGWGLNGGGASPGITPTLVAPLSLKGKGKQPLRRRSSASANPSRLRSSSRSRATLLSPISPSLSIEDQIESEMVMTKLISYGQSLQADYGADERPGVAETLERTLSLVAFEDPGTHPPAKEMIGQQARVELAEDVNKAILASMKKPTISSLEQLYRHTAVTVETLGYVGVGVASFADATQVLVDRYESHL